MRMWTHCRASDKPLAAKKDEALTPSEAQGRNDELLAKVMGEFEVAKAKGLLDDGFDDFEGIGEEGDDTEWVIWRADEADGSAACMTKGTEEVVSEAEGPITAVVSRESKESVFPPLGELQTEEGKFVNLDNVLKKRGIFLFSFSRCTLLSVLKYPWKDIQKQGYAVYGIGSEPMKTQAADKAKFKYPHSLICDTSLQALKKLDLIKPDGRRARSSYFLIEKGGRILLEKRGDTPKKSVKAVEDYLEEQRRLMADQTPQVSADAQASPSD